jgi:DNA-directed RNA polymerase subunit RPC12/RpoP
MKKVKSQKQIIYEFECPHCGFPDSVGENLFVFNEDGELSYEAICINCMREFDVIKDGE